MIVTGQKPIVASRVDDVSVARIGRNVARFSAANRLLSLKYATLPTKAPEDEPGETPKQAFARAHAAVGRPWVGRGTKSSLLYYATKARNTSSSDRIARQRVLRAFLLGGPDAQVM